MDVIALKIVHISQNITVRQYRKDNSRNKTTSQKTYYSAKRENISENTTTYQKRKYVRKHNVTPGKKSKNVTAFDQPQYDRNTQHFAKQSTNQKSHFTKWHRRKHTNIFENIFHKISDQKTWHFRKHNHNTVSEVPSCTSKDQRPKLQSIRTIKDVTDKQDVAKQYLHVISSCRERMTWSGFLFPWHPVCVHQQNTETSSSSSYATRYVSCAQNIHNPLLNGSRTSWVTCGEECQYKTAPYSEAFSHLAIWPNIEIDTHWTLKPTIRYLDDLLCSFTHVNLKAHVWLLREM